MASRAKPFDLDTFLSTVNGGGLSGYVSQWRNRLRARRPRKGVFYIESGDCKVSVISEQGKEAVVALHGKGDFFGEGCLTGQRQRLATVTAMSDLEVMRFDNAAIQRVLHAEPAFSELFISHLLERNARVEADLVDQLFNSSEKRLARLLLLMANFGEGGKREPVIAKISQETLAEMIGTTRSRVSAFMQVPQIRLHRIQRRPKSAQLAVKCDFA